jgi:hypothetical protein
MSMPMPMPNQTLSFARGGALFDIPFEHTIPSVISCIALYIVFRIKSYWGYLRYGTANSGR